MGSLFFSQIVMFKWKKSLMFHLLSFERSNYFSLDMQAPAIDMCATTDDKLIIHQAGGLCEVDIHDKGTVLKEGLWAKHLNGFQIAHIFKYDTPIF